MNEIVIKGTTVYDGTGAEPSRADIAISDDRIVKIGDDVGSAATSLECHDMSVAPGFIDVHTHDDFALAADPDMGFKVLGGVTTSIIGNCGEGPAPHQAAQNIWKTQYPDADLPRWADYRSYINWLEQNPPALNVVTLVGHGTLRAGVMNGGTGAALPRQRAEIQDQLEAALDAGASGASFGLFYEPGRSAARNELLGVARTIADRGLILAVHLRDEGAGLLNSIDEILDLARDTGVRLQVSHHKAAGVNNHGLVLDSLKKLEMARHEGLEVNCDQYPYTASSTHLEAVLSDPEGVGGFNPSNIDVCLTGDQTLCGLSLEQLGKLWKLEPVDAAVRLSAESPETTVILRSMSEADVISVLSDPHTMIGSDGLPNAYGISHPRLYGTFARVIGRYARDARIISVEEAIHRMTGLAARTFGLRERGELAPGNAADLVVFSLPAIMDRDGLGNLGGPPSGIQHVIVNGELVVRDGEPTGARPGVMIRNREWPKTQGGGQCHTPDRSPALGEPSLSGGDRR